MKQRMDTNTKSYNIYDIFVYLREIDNKKTAKDNLAFSTSNAFHKKSKGLPSK